MTSQEKELLSRFLQQMNATRAGQKDSEADALIRDAVAQQPDAGYLLVQRAMQLEQLLEVSQAQVQKLQAELDKSRSGSAPASGSFLSDPTWGSRPAAASSAASLAPAATMQRSVSGAPIGAPPAMAAAAAPPGAATRATGWGGGSMLGTVASTAAGVVAGSFLFQGIQGLMNRGDNTAAGDQNHQAQLEDSPHTSGSLYENPSDDLNNLAEVEDTDSFAGDEGGGDFA